MDDRDPSRPVETVNFIATVVRASDREGVKPTGREGVKPTGTVQFMLDGINVGKPITLDANGRAVWSTSDLKVGKHKIAVNYTPTSGSVFLPSGSVQISHTVIRPEGGVIRRFRRP
jgi:hypothetical protein